MSDSTQHSKKLRVAATLHDESGQSPFWATVVLYEDLRAAAVCRGATSRESEELARRFVAAWNAVEGVPTEWLEAQFDSVTLQAARRSSMNNIAGHAKDLAAAVLRARSAP